MAMLQAFAEFRFSMELDVPNSEIEYQFLHWNSGFLRDRSQHRNQRCFLIIKLEFNNPKVVTILFNFNDYAHLVLQDNRLRCIEDFDPRRGRPFGLHASAIRWHRYETAATATNIFMKSSQSPFSLAQCAKANFAIPPPTATLWKTERWFGWSAGSRMSGAAPAKTPIASQIKNSPILGDRSS